MVRVIPGPQSPAVFAVASDAVQVTHRNHLDLLVLRGAGGEVTVDVEALHGSITVGDLQPDTEYQIEARGRLGREAKASRSPEPEQIG